MKPTLDYIREIARQAGEIIQSYVGVDLDVQHKSRTDLVTRADHASEDFLIDTIRKSFPDHGVNAEELGRLDGAVDHQWYIDPLDGTLNFAHNVPFYAVSIAYAYQGQIELGVVYDPAREELFSAERGQGAFLNGKPLHVSAFTELVDCMLVTGFPKDVWGTPQDNMREFLSFSKVSQTVRRLGSAALDIVYVGAGRLDGFWELTVNNWDIAAGCLIVEEAGGVVTDLKGGPDYLKEPISVVCANPAIHQKMLVVLNPSA